MSWELIKDIQSETDLRLVLPFGLSLQVGDVISVGRRDGIMTLEGTTDSLLGCSVSKRKDPGSGPVSFMSQSHKGMEIRFRAAGEASTLFEGLPSAKAGADIAFSSANAWIMGVIGRSLSVASETAELRQKIIDAYRRGVWQPDWALVNSVGTVNRMTLLASRSGDSKVALEFGGNTSESASPEFQLTSDARIVAMRNEITQCITTEPMTAFCSGIRVVDRWFRDSKTGTLSQPTSASDICGADVQEVWEDADKLV